MQRPVGVVVGVPGNGAAIARRFAAEGYATALIARRPELIEDLARELGPAAKAYRCDAGEPASLVTTCETIQAELGPVDVLVYNAARASAGRWRRSPLRRSSRRSA
jgi:NAD(P)-dependent dehydrogenase (short-subunit alcohol dehydrogenase family)